MEQSRNGTGRKFVTGLGALLGVALVAVGRLQLAPPSLGGRTSYAVITGNSMEPTLHGGDLAIIRKAPSYGERDVAAYESGKLHTLVLHRIVGTEGDRFVMKGDNNDFLDVEKPTEDKFVGTLWVNIPKAGVYLAKFRDPRVAVPFAALVGFIAMFLSRRGARKTRKHGSPATKPVRHGTGIKPKSVVLVTGIVIMVISASIGAFAFSRPQQTSAARTVGYRQQGEFSYSASVDKGAVYDSATVTTGDPIYTKVAKDLTVSFDYHFDAESAADVDGEGSMITTLAASNGWARTIAETKPVALDGATLHLDQSLNIAELQRLVKEIETQTGVAETAYTLAFTTHVDSHGKLADSSFEDSFDASLPLQVDAFEMQLDRGEDGGAIIDPTNHSDSGSVTVHETNTGAVEFGGLGLDISAVRVGAGAGLAIGLLLLAATMLIGRPETDGLSRIESRHDDLIVRVASADKLGWDSAVEVENFAALKKLADAYETMLLHDANRDGTFFTICVNQLYFCRIESSDTGADSVGCSTPLQLRSRVAFVEDLVATS